LDCLAVHLCRRISQRLREAGIEHTINQIGSMFTLFFNPGPVTDYDSAARSDTTRYAKYFNEMLKTGVYLPPSQFEACFLSTQHSEQHIAKTLAALRRLSF
jgi:glutamate-1-semialdehyde 2,1-aminomutase